MCSRYFAVYARDRLCVLNRKRAKKAQKANKANKIKKATEAPTTAANGAK